MNNKRVKAELLLVIVTIIWGGTFAITKQGLANTTPLMLIAIRFGLSFLLFTPFFYRKFKVKSSKTIVRGLILGFLMFIGYGAQTIGLNLTSASRAGFITYTFALFVPFLQFYILKRKPSFGNVIGLFIVIVGMWLISNPGKGSFNTGDLILLGAALAYAFYIVYLDLFNKNESPELMTSIQFLVTAILSFIFSFAFEKPFLDITKEFTFSMLYLVILGSVFSLYIMNLYQKDTSPMKAVLIYSLEPVFGVVFAIMLLQERLTTSELLGSLVILLGVLLSEFWIFLRLGKRRRKTDIN